MVAPLVTVVCKPIRLLLALCNLTQRMDCVPKSVGFTLTHPVTTKTKTSLENAGPTKKNFEVDKINIPTGAVMALDAESLPSR